MSQIVGLVASFKYITGKQLLVIAFLKQTTDKELYIMSVQ